jgi:hypothetical protein
MATAEQQANGTRTGQLGSALLLVGGLALVGLMAYTLLIDGSPVGADRMRPGTVEVAVVLPTRDDWHDVRQGVLGCVRREMVELVSEEPNAVTIETADRGRPLRFVWVRAPGAAEARKVVDQLLARSQPPAAVIGSINTSLTAALAAALRDGGGARPGGPLLLLPWATSTLAPAGPMREPVPLLEINAGRTFRFCPDNRRLADLVVRCVLAQEPSQPPHSALIVEDHSDPYSDDLAAAFETAIRAEVPGTAIDKGAESLFSPGMGESPGLNDDRLAIRVWSKAREAPPGAPTWLVLPLQGAPVRRILYALDRRASGESPPLHVLCGDGLGITSLRDFTRLRGVSVWCGSAESPPDDGSTSLPPGALVPAEIVSALALAVDRAGTGPDALRTALAALDLKADDPAAFGRPLAFAPTGQRRDEALGHVLAVRPGGDGIVAFAPVQDGRWEGPIEVADPPPAQGP